MPFKEEDHHKLILENKLCNVNFSIPEITKSPLSGFCFFV